MRSKIIGIGGCSRSGKSSLARKIKEELNGRNVLLLDMDDFVFPESEIPKIKDRTDWECPESVDFERLIRTIEDSKGHDVIVVEGILVFAHPPLASLMDVTIWMQLTKKAFLDRRKQETRWGDEPDWFLEHVWESHLQYGQYPNADFIISGEEDISTNLLHTILSKL